MKSSFYRRRAKRWVDVVLASLGLAASAPLLGAVAALVWLQLGPPVLFRQWRAGRDGRAFRLIKLRTMSDRRGPDGRPLPDEERLTPFGRWLRASSLDELPGLWNVIRGEMSLVGPRPLLTEYLSRYSAEQARRHEALPGITGWAQVRGRNATDWEARLADDVWYVDNLSAALDARIVARTVLCVVARRGVTAEGHATMPTFTGTPAEPRPDRERADAA